MISPKEQSQILAEVESILREHGIVGVPAEGHIAALDFVRVREIAHRVLHGDMNREELSALTPEMTAELSVMVKHLIALRSSASVRQLEGLNPYYSAYNPGIIRDGIKEP